MREPRSGSHVLSEGDQAIDPGNCTGQGGRGLLRLGLGGFRGLGVFRVWDLGICSEGLCVGRLPGARSHPWQG